MDWPTGRLQVVLHELLRVYVTVLVQVHSNTVRVVFVEVYRLGSPFIIPLAREIA
jgi:hypothetical protein